MKSDQINRTTSASDFLKTLRQVAKQAGTDKPTSEEIEAEIAAAWKENLKKQLKEGARKRADRDVLIATDLSEFDVD